MHDRNRSMSELHLYGMCMIVVCHCMHILRGGGHCSPRHGNNNFKYQTYSGRRSSSTTSNLKKNTKSGLVSYFINLGRKPSYAL